MEEVLIVDGYNIIGAWPELNRLKEISLEDARDRLIDIMADFQGFSGMRLVLVFDAHQVPGLGGKYRQHRLQIVYTKQKETADELIERLVAETTSRRIRVHVATSDSVEQHITFGHGALRLSARDLKLMVDDSVKEISTRIKHKQEKERNTFDSKLDQNLLDIMEKWRRGNN